MVGVSETLPYGHVSDEDEVKKVMDSYKQRLMGALPLDGDKLTVRVCTRQDVEVLSRWPEYPWPDQGFRFSFAGMGASELDELFERRSNDSGRITV
ncbi:MAG: hypothetical protein FWD53_00750, partial [Phycisphaerales bacterium]|nr:hypothetical protein [Phycisphaerales bacterium]